MDEITVPRSQQRDAYSAAGCAKLKESIKRHGILVPLIVRQTGVSQYEVVDGMTRLRV